MALSYAIIETRPHTVGYLIRVNVIDEDTVQVWNHEFNPPVLPDAAGLDILGALAQVRTELEIEYNLNGMNLTTDEVELLEYYRGIKRDNILRIRQFPGATVQQARDYIATEYPNSPFDFDELYAIWIGMIGVTTWAQFKTWVINHKFRMID